MKTPILYGGLAVIAVAAPAVLGLWGNASFAQSVPVTVPDDARVLSATVTPTPTPTPTATPTPSPVPGVDDHGGDVPRDQRTEPGDDRDANGIAPATGDASGSGPGSPDSGSDDSGSNSGSGDSGSNSGPSEDDGSYGSDDGADDSGHHGGDG